MIKVGKVVKSDSGRRIRVDGLIKAGGQGTAYWATEMNSREKGVLKVFHKQFDNDETAKRIQFLIGQDLSAVCPVLWSPTDPLVKRDLMGHYTPLAPGKSLEEVLTNPDFTFIEGLQLAITLAHAIDAMHKRQMAHGDLHADNLIVNHTNSVFQLYVIDLDNFNAPGVPAPPCIGHNLYMAPELRESTAKRLPAIPTVHSDRFSLGVLMHEIILLRHTAAGADENEADFHEAMCSGIWSQDPAGANRPSGNVGGYPVEVLNADLARLFRAAVSLEPEQRPSPDTWERELGRAFNSIYCCPNCGGPCVIDVSKVACPLCRQPFPHLTMRIPGTGPGLSLAQGATVVGRTELGGSMRVSLRHAVFRRVGPETWIESIGSNGTCRWNGSGWTRLPDKKPLLVQGTDRLMLGDVEVQLY